jgi:hypothetical protein
LLDKPYFSLVVLDAQSKTWHQVNQQLIQLYWQIGEYLAKITKDNYEISRVAIVKEKGMKDIWVLASNTELVPREIINCYAKRWKRRKIWL